MDRPPPLITLTTDFGLADQYVPSVKGVILCVNPRAVIMDVTHEVRPQRIEQAAFLLAVTLPYLPTGAIHIVVVDPGVGTERRALAIETPQGFFVGPDNGCLSAALPDEARPPADAGLEPRKVSLPSGFRAVEIRERAYMRQPVSNTFHGRDVFAPAAAHLSLGIPLEKLGPPVGSVLALPPFRARRQADGSLAGRVVHVDRYGNLITDVRGDDLPAGRVAVEIRGQTVTGPARTYAEGPDLMAVVGGSGYLGIALRNSSAAALLGADIGEPVLVRPDPSG